VSRAIVVENKWRAQRYGIHETFVDEARPRGVPFAHWLDQVIDEAADDAAALGCLDEVARCRAIVANGTSADAQLALYRRARDEGAEREEALAAVSEWLAQATVGQDDPGEFPGAAAVGARTHSAGLAPHVPPCVAIRLDRDLTPDMPAI
jgi:glutamate---cysteine ligase / carboxylate-amine ligase